MKAVILAAGTSLRLRPLTDDRPKCLLPVAGKPILRRAIEQLMAAGVSDIVLVTGYLEEQVRQAVSEWFPGLPAKFVTNPGYATTNNACSLLVASREAAGAEMLLLDGDLVFDAGVVTALRQSARPDCIALRRTENMTGEEMKIEADPDGRVKAISKQVPVAHAAGESIGIELFSRVGSQRLFAALADRVEHRGFVQEYYEASFQELVDLGVPLYAVDVTQHYCTEIDTPEDLAATDRELRARGEGASG